MILIFGIQQWCVSISVIMWFSFCFIGFQNAQAIQKEAIEAKAIQKEAILAKAIQKEAKEAKEKRKLNRNKWLKTHQTIDLRA